MNSRNQQIIARVEIRAVIRPFLGGYGHALTRVWASRIAAGMLSALQVTFFRRNFQIADIWQRRLAETVKKEPLSDGMGYRSVETWRLPANMQTSSSTGSGRQRG